MKKFLTLLLTVFALISCEELYDFYNSYPPEVPELPFEPLEPNRTKREVVSVCESSAIIGWTTSNWESYDTDFAMAYKLSLYSADKLVVSWNIPANSTIWSEYAFAGCRFVFTGLEPDTEYSVEITNVTESYRFEPVKFKTTPSKLVVKPQSVTEGSVILYEDFSLLRMTGDIAAGAAGYSSDNRNLADSTWIATGEDPIVNDPEPGWYLVDPTTETGLFNTLKNVVATSRYKDWALLAEDNTKSTICARPGYLKLGASAKCAWICTPELNCLQNIVDLELSFDAARYREDPRTGIVEVLTDVQVDDIKVVTSATRRQVGRFEIGENAGEWQHYTMIIPNVAPGSRIAIGADRAGIDGQHRFLVDNIELSIRTIYNKLTNQIVYTSTDDKIVEPKAEAFNAKIVSNIYKDGQGVITFSDDVTLIGNEAFRDCATLATISIPDSVVEIGDNAFTASMLEYVVIPDSVTSIGYGLFQSCTNLQRVGWPKGVNYIPKLAFNCCKSLEFEIPDHIETIGSQAFSTCEKLTQVHIPQSVTLLDGYNPFSYCSNISKFSGNFASADGRCLVQEGKLISFAPANVKEYVVADDVTSIGVIAFAELTELEKVTIPQSVTTVNFDAFKGTSSLSLVCCKAATPPTAVAHELTGWNAFDSNAADRKIYVPAASLQAYKTADGWSEYADAIVAESIDIMEYRSVGCEYKPTTLTVEWQDFEPNRAYTIQLADAVSVLGTWDVAFGRSSLVNGTGETALPTRFTFGALTPSTEYIFSVKAQGADDLSYLSAKFTTDAVRDVSNMDVLWNGFDDCIFGGDSHNIAYSLISASSDALKLIDWPIVTNTIYGESITSSEPVKPGIADRSAAIQKYCFADPECSLYNWTMTSCEVHSGFIKVGSGGTIGSVTTDALGDKILNTTVATKCNVSFKVSPRSDFNPSTAKVKLVVLHDDGSESVVASDLDVLTGGDSYNYAWRTHEVKDVPLLSTDKLCIAADADQASGSNSRFHLDDLLVVATEVVEKPVDPSTVDLSLYADLSAEGTANCYLVQTSGNYKFKAVKGNSTESVGAAQSAKVLWETFGTSTTPNVGDLVAYAGYKDDYIYFSTPATFNNGNASIAVYDANGTILWSWHIWCSAEGWSDHVYANNAGTMMDRNLGATSATPGNVGALGLMYQWGRKDPFMGSGDILTDTLAASTGSWTTINSSQTIDYAEENPMTYITTSDWCSNAWDNYEIRWKESEKSLYDPCPIGYRMPKGGESGFWATAQISTSWDSMNKGCNCTLADGTTAWYPAVGYRSNDSGSLYRVGESGFYWSASPTPSSTSYAYLLSFNFSGYLNPTYSYFRGYGYSVRCVRDIEVVPETPATHKILYTSTDGNVVTPYATNVFGANIVSNTYENGQGTITFDSAVTQIGANAFRECETLLSIELPESITAIGEKAFGWCGALDSIVIPQSVTSIGSGAFACCYNITKFEGKFATADGLAIICGDILVAYAVNSAATAYAIPEGVVKVGYSAFNNNRRLVSITIPDSVQSIEEYAFCNSMALTSISIPNGVTAIEDYTLFGCNYLKDISLGSGVKSIGYAAFGYCIGLDTITIPENVEAIGALAFEYCESLSRVYCERATPPTLGGAAFDKNATDRKIYVPTASVEAYKTANGWNAYADAIVPDSDNADVDLSLYADLSAEGTANCYLVQAAGNYKFKAVKGNSTESVGAAQSAKVLWETFGTDVTPNVGDLVVDAGYKDDYIYFSTNATFNNGNASIAVYDANGTILWSWHIWYSAEGWNDHVYANNAGTMMDRNLGATSATSGSVGALGLLYQWGRKDPFLSSRSISANTLATSTITFPSAVTSTSATGTIEYATSNPTTFIIRNTSNYDWYYTGDSSTDDTRWMESEKAMYDPCPVGYRVPKGGESGFWATALGTSSSTSEGTTWDDTNKGRHWTLADGTTAWYPAVGYRHSYSGALNYVGSNGYCWSASPNPGRSNYAYNLRFYFGNVGPANSNARGYGYSVRCVRE